jgi:hypothetical protein
MAILTIGGVTIMEWAGAMNAGQHSRPAQALAHLTCKAFRVSHQVQIHGPLAVTQIGTYTAVVQRTCGRMPGDSRARTEAIHNWYM